MQDSEVLERYPRISLKDARSEIGALCEKAAYQRKRVILVRHDKPLAAIVPMRDLLTVHQLDIPVFEAMARRADAAGADSDDLLPLEVASKKEPDLMQSAKEWRYWSVITLLQASVTENIISRISRSGMRGEEISALRKNVAEGVQAGLEAPLKLPA